MTASTFVPVKLTLSPGMASTKVPLDTNWVFAQLGGGEANKDGEWLTASKAPTSVHAELLKLKKIPDPFVGLNEWEVQCMHLSSWGLLVTILKDFGHRRDRRGRLGV